MPATTYDDGSHKRKQAQSAQEGVITQKKPRTSASNKQPQMLITPHESIIAELNSKHKVLPASVISSTPIRKRVTSVLNHLREAPDQSRVALLYARTADVCKLITVVEQCKRLLVEEGKAWYQYNQLFDQPEAPKKRDLVEETVLEKEGEGGGSDSDDFEVMHSRFEDAVLPPPTTQSVKSMRVFLSTTPILELRSKRNVTTQSSDQAKR